MSKPPDSREEGEKGCPYPLEKLLEVDNEALCFEDGAHFLHEGSGAFPVLVRFVSMAV